MHVESRGGHLLCHMDGSARGEWGSGGGPSVATVMWMVVHVGSGGAEGDHLLCHIDGSACGEWGSRGGPSVVP